MQDTKLKVPKCEKCGEPMQLVDTVMARKENETLVVRIYTCYEDKTFSRIEDD